MHTILKKISIISFIIAFLSINSYGFLTNYVEDSIPMRDGKYLKCDVYIPSGCTTCPTILIQTPYWKNLLRLGLPFGVNNNAQLDAQPYVYVVVDWRGFWGSLPAWVLFPNRGEDGYDVIEWVSQQTWSDGKVGTWGPSALGNVQYQTAREQHPNHTCMVPLVAGPQISYEEYFPGGSARVEYIDQLDGLNFGVSSWVVPHPTHDGLWDLAEPPSWYPDSIEIPTLMIGGWYDHNVEKMIEFWNAIRSISPAKDDHRLLMGPWAHGGSGTAQVGTTNQGELSYPLAEDWNDIKAIQFFDYHLRGVANSWDTTSFVTYYQPGTEVWAYDTVWPPQGTTTWDFELVENSGSLFLDPSPSAYGLDSVTVPYDPNDPSPTWGGPTLRADQAQGPFDLSDTVETRGDVLMFNYLCDQDVILQGVVTVHLKVSANVYDTDFAVRICDVTPTGESYILLDDIQRLRFRNGYEDTDTAMMIPGQIYDIEMQLPDIAYTFLTGHTLRLIVSGSNYPRFNRNMNTGGAMHPNNTLDTLVSPLISTNVVYTGPGDSYVRLPLTGYVLGTHDMTGNLLEISVYPNPTHSELTIDLEDCTGNNFVVDLYDAGGRLVLQVPTENCQLTMPVGNLLEAGQYFAIIKEDGEAYGYAKFVVD